MVGRNTSIGYKRKRSRLLVSVIIPVYNAECFLTGCVDSVINQDIGFTENIELILVNDGSTDGSDAICRSYAEKYPDNVVYIVQKNSGASHARNTGIKAATGKFISFIDADDYVSEDIVGAAMDYFKTAKSSVDVAISRVIQFGSKNKERPINKKFNNGTTTADLRNPDWYDVYPRVAPSFIRAKAAKKHTFHEDIRFYEDTRYICEVLSDNMKLGIVDEGIYFNRMHDSSDNTASITTGATSEKRYYQDSPEKVSLYLLKNYKTKDGYPPLYMQYLAMYEMRWRMFYNPNNPKDVLSPSEYKVYKKINKEILSLITDDAITEFKLYSVWQRVYLLNLKHNTDVLKKATFNEKNKLVWHDKVLFNHKKKLQTRLTDYHIDKNHLVLEGYFAEFVVDGIDVYPRINGKRSDDFKLFPNSVDLTETPLEYPIQKRTGFVARVPLSDSVRQHVDFAFTLKNKEFGINRLVIVLMFESGEKIPKYSKVDGYLISWRRESLSVARDTLLNRVLFDVGRIKRYLVVSLLERRR